MPPSFDLLSEIEQLKASRDAALNAARSAVRDATRVTRLLMALNDRLPFDLLLENILATVSELFSADVAALLDPTVTGHFQPVASVGLPEGIIPDSISKANALLLSDLIRKAVVITPEMMQEESILNGIFRKLNIVTAVCIPMKGSGETRGALILGRCVLSLFTSEEIDLLHAMVYRIALALEQVQHKQRTYSRGAPRQTATANKHDPPSFFQKKQQIYNPLI